jgi:hypothetical protein
LCTLKLEGDSVSAILVAAIERHATTYKQHANRKKVHLTSSVWKIYVGNFW